MQSHASNCIGSDVGVTETPLIRSDQFKLTSLYHCFRTTLQSIKQVFFGYKQRHKHSLYVFFTHTDPLRARTHKHTYYTLCVWKHNVYFSSCLSQTAKRLYRADPPVKSDREAAASGRRKNPRFAFRKDENDSTAVIFSRLSQRIPNEEQR